MKDRPLAEGYKKMNMKKASMPFEYNFIQEEYA
jgi:hypothetical protein